MFGIEGEREIEMFGGCVCERERERERERVKEVESLREIQTEAD